MYLCVYDSTWEHPNIRQPEVPLFGSQWEESVLGKSTTHIVTLLSFVEAQDQVRGTGAAAGFEGPLGTLSSLFQPHSYIWNREWQRGRKEGEKRRDES